MKKEYDTFVTTLDELPQGRETELTIRDLTPGLRKYESNWVKAVVSNSPKQMPDGDVLWLRFPLGFLHPRPWAIKVVRILGDYMPR
jgi:hypothetical protein